MHKSDRSVLISIHNDPVITCIKLIIIMGLSVGATPLPVPQTQLQRDCLCQRQAQLPSDVSHPSLSLHPECVCCV